MHFPSSKHLMIVAKVSVVAIFSIGLIGAVSLLWCDRLDGAFPQAEYRLILEDNISINPNDLIVMDVIDSSGKHSPAYPIVEYTGVALRPAGVRDFIIHHLSLGPEYPITRRKLFWSFPCCYTDPPEYSLVFSSSGRQLVAIRYSDLVQATLSDFTNIRTQWTCPEFNYPDSVEERRNPNKRHMSSTDYRTINLFVLHDGQLIHRR
jgi:hypothetical protein